MNSKLMPSINEIDHFKTENDLLDHYYSIFLNEIYDTKDCKLTLFSQKVFISGFGHTANKHNFFWKIASFDTNKENYDVYPCNNTHFKNICGSYTNNLITNLNRQQCSYRGAYILWIKHIFDLANSNSNNISMYIKEHKYNGTLQDRLYIVFHDDNTTYLITLAIQKSRFEFVTGHPVTHRYQYDKVFKAIKNVQYTKNIGHLKTGLSNYFISKK